MPPERIIDYLALVGDTSDNIPGVPKVGPKTAAKWLNEYGTLDEVIAHAGEIKGKVGENLRDNLDTLALSRRLVTIHCDVALELAPDQLHVQPADVDGLRELYTRLDFKRWLDELGDAGGAPLAPAGDAETAPDYETILTRKRFAAWLEKLRQAELIAVDTETTSLEYTAARIVGLSFAVAPGEAAYLPLAHDYVGAPEQLNRESVLQELRPMLENSGNL